MDALIVKAQELVSVDPFRGLAHAAKAQQALKAFAELGRRAKGFAIPTNRLIASRIRAERVGGDALVAIDREGGRGGGPGNKKTSKHDVTKLQVAIAEVGITRMTALRWQYLKTLVDDETFEAYVSDEHIAREKQLSSLELLREATRAAREEAIRLAREKAAAEAATAVGDNLYGVEHGSFVDISKMVDDNSLSLIFTDPPYHDKTLPLYADLGVVAARVLKDGGSLITYTSHHRIPEVIEMLHAAGLTFFWPLAMVHTGQKARMTEYGIVVHWKPLLWFVKGRFRDRTDMQFVNDLIESQPEKSVHPWQQGTIEARYYIEHLSRPNDLIFDPFCGGGTTAVACAQTQRRWLTCDIDEASVLIARQRIQAAINEAAA
jgi:hypothetical protein